MFNISSDYAPPFKMIEPFFKFGSIAFLISIISLLFIDVNTPLFDLKVVGWAHLFLLGFVMIVIFGAMAQLIPVALEIGHYKVKLFYYIFPTLAIGTITMVIGFWFKPFLLPFGGFLVLVSMILFLYETFMTLKATTANSLTVKSVKFGNIFLTIAIFIGFLMALALSGVIPFDVSRFLPIHIILVLVGYVTVTIIGMSMILLPMFGLAHGYDDSDVHRAFWIIVASVIAFSIFQYFDFSTLKLITVILIFGAVGLYLRQMITLYNIRARKIHDIWYKHIYIAFISLALSVVFGVFWVLLKSDIALKVMMWFLLIGFFAFIINAHLIKIIPFLVWFERFSPLVGKQKVPMLHEMLPDKDVNFSFWASLAGLLISGFGLLIESDTLFKGGVVLLAFGAFLMFQTVLFILNFKPESEDV
jgi:hypothetical protein